MKDNFYGKAYFVIHYSENDSWYSSPYKVDYLPADRIKYWTASNYIVMKVGGETCPKRKKNESDSEYRSRLIAHYIDRGYRKDMAAAIAYKKAPEKK